MKIFQPNDYPRSRIQDFYSAHHTCRNIRSWCLTHWDGISFSYFLSFTKEPCDYLCHPGPNTTSWPYLADRLFFPWEGFHMAQENWSPLYQGFYPVTEKLQAAWVERLVLGHYVKSNKISFWSKYLKITLFLVWPPCSSYPVSL